MSAGHLTEAQSHWNQRVKADIKRKHARWPLGTIVGVKTPAGYLTGRINKHWLKGEVAHGATVLFDRAVNIGDANGTRECHVFPFRSLRKLSTKDHCHER